MKIYETKKTYVKGLTKKGNEKWIIKEEETTELTKEMYLNTVNPKTKKFFQNLGGYERHIKSYTVLGYVVTHVNSISPDRNIKITRDFTIR